MQNLKGWELDNLMSELRAGAAPGSRLAGFLRTHHPFAAVKADYSLLLILRLFDVRIGQDERRVFNCPPEGADHQWGVTVVMASPDGGGSQTNVYLPNSLPYTGLQIIGEQVFIQWAGGVKTTNAVELLRKMAFYGKFTEAQLVPAFATLTDEQYEPRKVPNPAANARVLTSEVLGELTYNPKYEWYEGVFAHRNTSFALTISWTDAGDLARLVALAETRLSQAYYEAALLAMEAEMVELKNDAWLDEDEQGHEEQPLTGPQFRARVSIASIHFHADGSSVIYCDDDDIFAGHTIVVEVDEAGNFAKANLAG